VAIVAGPDARFENSGWMGITAAGTGTTHQISGLFAQTAAGTLSVRVSPTVADSLQVDGRAVLAGTVNVAAQPGTYVRNTTYAILNATGGLDGTFAGGNTNLPFLKPLLSYDTQNVFLSLVTGFAAGAQTGNQRAVGTVLDGVSNTATGDFSTVLNVMANLGTSQGTAALDAISGQAYSGFGSANLASGLLFMNAVSQQMSGLHGGNGGGTRVALAEACDATLADACDGDPTHRWGAWIAGLGGVGSVAGNNGAGTLTYNLGGVAVGADYRFDPRFLAGVGVGYSSGRQWVNGSDGQANTDNFNLSLYGSYAEGAAYVDALVGYGYNDNQMRRNISIPGLQPRTALGQTNANQFLGQVEAGYRFGIFTPTALSLTPFARLQASTGTQAGFTETGANSLNLTVAQQTTDALRSTFGVDLGGAIDAGWREKLAFRVRVGWAHEFADTSRPTTAAFAGAPGFGFTVLGAAPQRDGAVLGLALNTAVGAATSIYARYDGEVGGSTDNHVFSAGLRMTW
jgi:outer membrane autotransporter protein